MLGKFYIWARGYPPAFEESRNRIFKVLYASRDRVVLQNMRLGGKVTVSMEHFILEYDLYNYETDTI